MLIEFDEYLIHPTQEPLAHPVSMDRNHYDRYWLGGFAADASLYFAFSLGLYPNRQVMDAAFSVTGPVLGGEQRACFASRHAPPASRTRTVVGPIALEVIEPLRTLRLRLAQGESGIEADLVFRAHTGCVEEDRQILKRGHATAMDVTRFTQFGRFEGEIRVDGQRIAIDPAQVHGVRDRSWGRRNVGEPEGGAPAGPPQIYFLWAPLIWADEATLAVFFEDAQGHALHAEAKAVGLSGRPADPADLAQPPVRRFHGATRSVRYAPGTRRAAQAEIGLVDGQGQVRRIQLEPLLCHRMKGTGYGHPKWKHGNWHGELATGHDRWRPDDLDPLALENLHIQQLVRCRDGTREGIGLLEQLCIGPHAPSGFAGLCDGAV